MGLKLYNDLTMALVNITDDSDEIIVFQSQVWQMCLKYKIAAKNISRIILNAIEDFSKNKTILFPSFSNDIIKYKKFDMIKSMPNTGLLPCYCLKTKKFKRTFSPLHGFLIKGPRSNEVLRLKQFSSWGQNRFLNFV